MTPRKSDQADSAPLLLTVPGLCCSGPEHWQSLWERTRGDCSRIELPDWDDPAREAWIVGIDRAVAGAGAGAAVILVAHSLGCLGVAWWAARARSASLRHVVGALLVAPPDVDRRDADPRLVRFAPTPLGPLPFPALLVASRDDPYAGFARSAAMAAAWGATFVDLGAAGHINAESRLGAWPEGQAMLARLTASARAAA